MAGTPSRIAEAYVQFVPVLGAGFAKQMKTAMNQALRSLNYDLLTRRLKSAGRQGGRDFKLAFAAAARGITADYSKLVTDAQRAARTSGRKFNTSFQTVAKAKADFSTLETDAGGVGKRVGKSIANDIEAALKAVKMAPIDPEVKKPRIPPWANNPAEIPAPVESSPSGGGRGRVAAMAAGAGGLIGGIGVGASMRFGVSTAADYDEAARKITASIGGTEKAVPKVSAAIKDLQKQGFDFETSVVAVEAALASNPQAIKGTAKDIEGLSLQVAKLGAQFETDLPNAALAASVMVKNKIVPNFAEGIAVLGVAMSSVPVTLREEFAEIYNEFSKNYNGMGFSAERAGALVAESGRTGGTQGMSQMSDFLKEGGILMTETDNEEIGEILKSFGMDQKATAADFTAGGTRADARMEKVILSIMNLKTADERASTAKKLFGTPLEDLGTHEIDNILTSVVNTRQDAMGDVLKKFDDNAAVAMGGFKREFAGIINELKIMFVDAFIPLIERLIPILGAVRNFIRDNSSWISKLIVPATIFLGIVSLIAATGAILFPVIGSILGTMGVIGIVAPAIVAGWAAVTAAIAATGLTVGGFILAAVGAGIAITAVIAAAAAAGTLIYGLWTDYDGTLKALRNNFGGFGSFVADLVENTGKEINWIVETVGRGIDWLMDKLDRAKGWLKETFGGGISTGDFSGGRLSKRAARGDGGGGLWNILPKMATGGDVLKATALIAGEKQPETIVNRNVMNEALAKMVNRLDSEESGASKIFAPQITINQLPGQTTDDILDQLIERLNEFNNSLMG